MIIGLSGVAGSGKDTFFSIFQELIKSRSVKRVALADLLKKEATAWTLPNYGIDALNCTREEKEIIRDFLVFHATQKRHETKGRHWIGLVSEELQKYKNSNDIAVITDIRYCDYEKDEIYWLKEELGGVLVHVSMYDPIPDPHEGALLRDYVPPCNAEEARNDPKIKQVADVIVEWPRLKKEDWKQSLFPFVTKAVADINALTEGRLSF